MNYERALASIARITSLDPIPGADMIEVATINGAWPCVVGKTVGHKVGDLVIYMEIDSFLPATDPRYESFSERFIEWNGKRGMRVKTIRLRKQLSQGVVMPVREYPELVNPVEGQDVTELLKIEKWETAEELSGGLNSGKAAGVFPSFLQKTNQPRAQNIASALDAAEASGELFERSIKLHGSSMTVYKVEKDSPYYPEALKLHLKAIAKPNKPVKGLALLIKKVKDWYTTKFNPPVYGTLYGVCSRNIVIKPGEGSDFNKVVEEQDLFETLEAIEGSVALQGEIIGPNIQQGFEKAPKLEFRLFDIFDIDKQEYLLPGDRKATADELDILSVPVDAILTLSDVKDKTLANDPESTLVKSLLAAAEGPGMNLGVKREGHVYKSLGRDFSFKVVATSFLERKGA